VRSGAAIESVESVFELAGRVRYAVDGLRQNPGAARFIESQLSGIAGVRMVEASPLSGRVLVIFDDWLPARSLHVALIRVRKEYLAEHQPRPAPSRTPKAESLGDAVWTATASGAALAALGVGTLGGGIVLSLAVAGAVALGAVALRRIREDGAATDVPKPHGAKARLTVVPSAAPVATVRMLFSMVSEEHRRSVLHASMLSAISAAAGVARIATIALMIDLVFSGSGSATALAMGAAAVLAALQTFCKHHSRVIWSTVGREIQHELRAAAYDRVQRAEMAMFLERKRGDLLSVLLEDIDNLEKAIDAGWAILDLAISSAALLASIAHVALTSASWSALAIPVLVGISVVLYPKLRERLNAVRRLSGHLASQVASQLEGVEIIKSFTAERGELARFRDASGKYAAASKHAVRLQSGFPMGLEAALMLALIVTMRVNVGLVVARGFSVGRFQKLNIMTGHLMFPQATLGMHLDQLSQGLSALRRVRQLLALEPELNRDDPDPVALERGTVRGDIRVDGVTFAYRHASPVLHNVYLRFAPGRTTAIVGLSGSGKTTLIKLLQRFYMPQSGRIELDGVDIARIDRHNLRRAISVVSQDVYLFDRSLLENLRISRPDATKAEIVAAAKAAQAHDFIMGLPDGYATRLGERGAKLSNGQRQCISIARAILKDSPIIVMDEATSSLDSNTEASIAVAMRTIFAGRTVIMIAHRLATVRQADHIYALESGRVIAEGIHDDLIARPGRYRSLWLNQTGQVELPPEESP
jgi:ATP-binding cassette subfamily B protein